MKNAAAQALVALRKNHGPKPCDCNDPKCRACKQRAKRLAAKKAAQCAFCHYEAEYGCDTCDKRFCHQHGQIARDCQGEAIPGVCDECKRRYY